MLASSGWYKHERIGISLVQHCICLRLYHCNSTRWLIPHLLFNPVCHYEHKQEHEQDCFKPLFLADT